MGRSIKLREGKIYEYDMHDTWTDDISNWWNDAETGPTEITIPARMTYPNGKRAYYQTNDLIFGVNLRRFELESNYLEYQRTKESDFSWAAFLMLVVGVTGDGTVVDKIVSISGTDDNGSVITRPFLKLSETEYLQLTHSNGAIERNRSFSEFKTAFIFNYYGKVTSAMIPLAEGMVDYISIFIGGGAKSIFTGLFKKFGKRKVLSALFKLGGKRMINIVTSKLSLKIAKFITRTSKDIIKKFIETNDIELIKKNPRSRINTERILWASIRDAVAESFTAEIVSGIESIFPDGTGKNMIPRDVRERITLFLTKHLLVVMLSPVTDFIKTAIKAVDFNGNSQTYASRVSAEFQTEMRTKMRPQTISATLNKALKELIEKPELVF